MNNHIIDKIISEKIPCYFISPHLDDAALSAGALIAHLSQHTEVNVINVFTEVSEGTETLSAKKFVKISGHTNAHSLFSTRIEEDKKALSIGGIQPRNLGFEDALWRRLPQTGFFRRMASKIIPEIGYVYPTYRMHIIRDKVSCHDTDVKQRLGEALKTITSKHTEFYIFCPMGIKSHVDHILVRDVCLSNFDNVFLWLDFPYNIRNKISTVDTEKIGTEAFVWQENKEEKKKMITEYKSQINGLFPDGNLYLVPEVYYFPSNKSTQLRVNDQTLPLEGNKQNTDCTIIILSYNTKEVIDECLTQTEIATQYAEKILGNKISTVVVDNGSKDGSAEMIRKNHPSVHLVALEENVGYGRANNMVLKKTETPFILLLNSDAFIRKETIVKAITYMTKNPSCDALGTKLVYPDGSFQASAGYLPTPFRTIRWAFGLESAPFLKNLIQPFYQYNQNFYKKERELEWASTGCFFLKKKVYDVTLGFDERLFLYMEDVEWCQRIKNNKLKICYSPEIDIVHLGGFSSKKLSNKELLRRHIEGLKHFHSVHYPKTKKLVLWCIMVGMGLRGVLYTLFFRQEKAKPYLDVVFSK